MKILMITPSYEPVVGGTEIAVKNLAGNLNRIGVETDILTLNMDTRWDPRWEWEILKEDGYNVYRVPAVNIFRKLRIPNFFSYFFRITVFINPEFRKIFDDYDILHFHDDVDMSFILFSLFSDKPRIFHIHTLQVTFNWYKYNLLSRFLLVNSSKIHITASESNAKLMRKLGAKNIELLPNGVDINKFTFNTGERDGNLILYVGRFERDKGAHILLESLKLLKTSVKMVFIGPYYDTGYLNDMQKVMEEINCEGKHEIIYLGSLSHYEIVKWQQRATIFVCPSLKESFGMVVLEAMSCGTPVIASEIGGIKEIITSHQDGILFSKGNVVQLAEAIESLLKDEDLRLGLARAGRKKVEEKFTWLTVARELSQIYRKILYEV